jgi:tetratricopeptide (TPR) repeat protein
MSPAARHTLGQALAKRAEVLAVLNRHTEAIRDWDQALRLAEPADRFGLHLNRTLAQARAGQHRQASMEAESLAEKATHSGKTLFQLACVYSLSAAAAGRDAQRTPDEQTKLAHDYAARAVEMLSQARETGYFKTPDHIDQLKQAADLNPLHPDAEFKKLLEELTKPGM